MAATMQDVARLAGVSIKTVSNVVNNYPYIRPETRTKVERAIEELGYQLNVSARGLRSGRTRALGLALPELSLSYFAELADRVIRAAERRGQVVLVEQTNGDRDRELALLRSPRLQFMDGLIFSPLGMTAADVDQLPADLPLVLLGEQIFGVPTDHVTMRNVEAAAAATSHLLALGRRRIAVIGEHRGEVIGSAGLRLRGYREALSAAGVDYDERIVVPAGLWHRANGADAMRELLSREVPFDAVFAFNDTLALGAMRVLLEAGRRIPRDVAVIGFDDLDESQYSLPSLSTVDPGRTQIAELAVDLLLERIEGRADAAPARLVEAPFAIVDRESTLGRTTR